jgi:Spy/CpxP family protein refolding chaperone
MERPGMGLKAVMMRRGLTRKRIGTSALMRLSRLRALRDELDLSDDQVRKLWDIESGLVRNVAKLTLEIRVARFDSLKTIVMRPVNFDQVRANAKNVMDLRLQRKMAIIDAFEQGVQVLTPEQKEMLSDAQSVWEDEAEEAIETEE